MRLEDLAGLDLNRLVVLAVLLEEEASPRSPTAGPDPVGCESHPGPAPGGPRRRPAGPGGAGAWRPLPSRTASGFPDDRARAARGPDPWGRLLTRRRRAEPSAWAGVTTCSFVVGGSWLPRCGWRPRGSTWWPSHRRRGPGTLLADGRLDLAFDVGLSDDDTLKGRLLFEDAFATLAGARGGFAPGPLSLEQFAAAPHLLVAPQGGPTGPVDRALASLGLRRRVALRLSHFLGVVDLIRASDLVTTLPRQLLLALGAPPERLLPPPLALPKLMVRVVWHERVHADPGVVWLRRTLVEHAGRRATSDHHAP